MNYIPLNIKSHYELLRSLIKIDDLVLYAKKNNIKALGITDSNMFSCMEFYNLCIKNDIKPIIGIDINIDDKSIILYARDYKGYISLCNIVSQKNLNTLDINYLKKHNNLICVCDKDDYSIFNDIFDLVYIRYSNKDELTESLLITENVVYMEEVLYFDKDDNQYYSYLTHIKNGTTINDKIDLSNNYFKEVDDEFDIQTTHKFISNIDIVFPKVTNHIPSFIDNSYEYLKALCMKGLNKRLNNNVESKYIERLKYELDVINNMGFVDYFLIVYDIVLYAKKNNIFVGPGRGSAAGSLVSYVLGITQIDPLKYDLIFERFLNPRRVTYPDIDIDFDSEKRVEIIEYVKNKYGVDYVGNIITFNKLLPKQAIRDVGRVFEFNNDKISKICKTIDNEDNFESLNSNKIYIDILSRDKELQKVIDVASKLCGLNKNTSIHAAGVVISDICLCDIMPLYKSGENVLTGYTKDYIESLGLLKMDFLSLKNLNTIFNVLNSIKKYDNKDIDLNKVSLCDKDVFKLFSTAKTTGIFQFEKSGMKSFLKQLNVESFDDLVSAISLYRPGPRDMISTFINRKHGKEKINYSIKELESILNTTYGIIIYQEQVLEILRKICGYSYTDADNIRKAMSKKNSDIIEKEKTRIISSITALGYNSTIAIDLFNQIMKFSLYGFNKSHAVVYALIAYQMAYLKVHFTNYFMIDLLNNEINSESKIKEYIDESKLLGIEFNKIDINLSQSKFTIHNNKIVLPFNIIKSINENISSSIIMERNNGLFKSFEDFMIRCYQNNINKKIVISLIESGAFDNFIKNKKMYITNLDIIINYITLCRDLDSSLVEKPILEECNDYTDSEKMDNEINNYGFYLSFHPASKYDRSKYITLENIDKYFNRYITSILLIESIKSINTKKGEKMSFITLSDEFNKIEGILFPTEYMKYQNIEKNRVYIITSKLEKRNNEYQLIINKIESIN